MVAADGREQAAPLNSQGVLGHPVAELTLAIPTYNEAPNVRMLLPQLRQAFSGTDLEILVVDDDSPDATAAAAEAVDPQARVLVRKGERGLATAITRAYEEASGDWVLVMDADFQHPIEAVQRIWDRARQGDVDLVIGSRYVEGGSDGSFTRRRRTVSRGARTLAALALPDVRKHHVTDPMSGLFAVRRAAIDGVKLRPTGYKILLEVLAKGRIRDVAEVGFVFADRAAGESKLGAGVIGQYVVHLMRLGIREPANLAMGAVVVAGATAGVVFL